MSTTVLDLLAPAVRGDPYAFYRLLQREAPVHWCPPWGWLVSRHADVLRALQDPRLTAAGAVEALFEQLPPEQQHELVELRRQLTFWMGNRSPAEHAQVRSLLRPAFQAHAIAPLRPVTSAFAARLLDRARGASQIDLVADFAQPLPAQVIAHVLGAATADHDRFQVWSRTLTEFLGFGMLETGVLCRAQRAVIEMTAFLRGFLETASADSSEGLMAQGARWIAEGQIQQDDFLANCVLLLFAGHETTTIAIANTLLLLMEHRDVFDRLRADPSGTAAVVQESLRYESPVQMIRRRAEADVDVGGRHLKRGDFVWLMLGAANRDPEVFAEPDAFDPERPNRRNLAFGFGPHYCLGAWLSIAETEEAVRSVVGMFPQPPCLTGPPAWLPNPTTRALETLPVAIDSGSGRTHV